MRLSSSDRSYITAEATRLGVKPAALLAIVEVESGGKVTERVGKVDMPLIRWEGHYFDRLVPAKLKERARAAGLASPKAGAILNPHSQASRYAMLARGMDIDKNAALMSISIGVGQVMISHWDKLGYSSPEAMFNRATSGFPGQLDLMLSYIVKFGLLDEIQRFDWAGFARGYNGPAYAKHGYHTKIAATYKKYSGGAAAPTSPASGMLRMGSKGARVRELQQLLLRAGLPIDVDGDFGPSTRDTVKEFQRQQGLEVDGVAGPRTMEALSNFRISPDETPGHVGALETDEAKTGAGGGAIGIGLTVATEKLDGIADRIGMQGVQWLDYASAGLYTISGLLVLGGLAWGAYGYFKAQRTYEGVS